MFYQFDELKLPQYATHVDARHELPQERSLATYWWRDREGNAQQTAIKNTERQLLDQLKARPIYAASRMNLSAYIDIMRHRHHLPIQTFQFRSDAGGSYGIYVLMTDVRLVGAATPLSTQLTGFAFGS